MISKSKSGHCTLKSILCGACGILPIALLSLTSGCSTAGGGGLFVRQPVATAQVVTVPGATNTVTDPVTHDQVVTIRPPTIVTNWITNEVVMVNPSVESGLAVARQVNELANPLPFAGAITGVLGLASLVLGWIARLKTQKARLVPVLIQGVELANDPAVKANIKQIASAVGLEGRLNEEVRNVTK